MVSNGNNYPIGNLTDGLRALFGSGDHAKKKERIASENAFQHPVFPYGHIFFPCAAAFSPGFSPWPFFLIWRFAVDVEK